MKRSEALTLLFEKDSLPLCYLISTDKQNQCIDCADIIS